MSPGSVINVKIIEGILINVYNFHVHFEINKMVRKLKFHEQKLLKKVDFISWEVDNNLHEVKILKKYHIQRREDYTK